MLAVKSALSMRWKSCEEISQLRMINELHFENYEPEKMIDEYDLLGAKINKFIQCVENKWITPTTRNT